MTFQSLEYFLAVYEAGGITAAAERLFVSQQTLSAQIRRMEEECKAPLFIRYPSFRPTFAGDRLAASAREILRLQKESLAELKEIGDGRIEQLHFGYSGLIPDYQIAPVLKQFYQQYPTVNLNIENLDSRLLESMTLSGELDFFIGRPERTTGELSVTPVMEIRMMAAIHADLLKEAGLSQAQQDRIEQEGLSLAELTGLPWILPKRGWQAREPLDAYIRANGLKPLRLLEARNTVAVEACSQGLGLAILYSTNRLPESESNSYVRIYPLRDFEHRIPVSFCCRKDHFLSSPELFLLETMIDLAADPSKNELSLTTE